MNVLVMVIAIDEYEANNPQGERVGGGWSGE